MKRSLLFFLFVCCSSTNLKSQNDSVLCAENCKPADGMYLKWEDFRTQHSIAKESIDSKYDKSHLDFLNKAMKEKTVTFSSNGIKTRMETSKIWGFFQNGYLFLNYNGEFYRVPTFGSISYLIAVVEVINPGGGYYTPGYGMMNTPYKTDEVRSFLMNYYDGTIRPFSQAEAEELISRDKDLFTEYNALKRKQRKEQIARYIRKYNERNPIYFLK